MRASESIARLRDAISGGQGQLLVVGIIVLVLLAALAAGGAYVAYLLSPRGRLQALLQTRGSRDKHPDWVIRGGVLLLLAATIAFAGWYTERPATCAQCHGDRKQEKALASSAHRGVTCSSCHTPAGATGPVRAGLAYARWVYVYGVTKKVPAPKPGSVDSGACLRCHSETVSKTVVRGGIRVRHSDFLDAGAACRDCHNSTAHPDAVTLPSSPVMSTCLACHDGSRARSGCSVCHVRDVSTMPSPRKGYGKMRISGKWDSCYECHVEKPCIRCHGIRMPHPPGWGPGEMGQGAGHARDGFTKREVCWRCHYAPGKPFRPSNEGCKCHGLFGSMHGGRPWIAEHGLEATGKKTGSNARCFDCHSDSLCDLCHPPSYRARYDPTVGPENYPRDIPQNKLDNLW